ncbi:MAG: hypothetical protein R3C15_19585 [Thermoleophilia bacterium]
MTMHTCTKRGATAPDVGDEAREWLFIEGDDGRLVARLCIDCQSPQDRARVLVLRAEHREAVARARATAEHDPGHDPTLYNTLTCFTCGREIPADAPERDEWFRVTNASGSPEAEFCQVCGIPPDYRAPGT